jgi:aminoglycoside 6'-N-acetyltransferase I
MDQLLAGAGVVVLAEANGGLVGFAEASVRSDHVDGTTIVPVAYLEGWYVVETHRRRGVGRSLLAFVEEWARERGHTELASDAEIGDASSIRLHSALGFKEVGRSVHFVKSLAASMPNQPPDPKSLAATAPAGAGGAPSVAADH